MSCFLYFRLGTHSSSNARTASDAASFRARALRTRPFLSSLATQVSAFFCLQKICEKDRTTLSGIAITPVRGFRDALFSPEEDVSVKKTLREVGLSCNFSCHLRICSIFSVVRELSPFPKFEAFTKPLEYSLAFSRNKETLNCFVKHLTAARIIALNSYSSAWAAVSTLLLICSMTVALAGGALTFS